jgi:hypothetical protein
MIALVLKAKRNKEWLNTVVLSGPKNRCESPWFFWAKFASEED